MDKIVLTGEATDSREKFVFTISAVIGEQFRLDIAYSGDGAHNTTGAGLWPTVEKAKSIAQETAARLLHGAQVAWQ